MNLVAWYPQVKSAHVALAVVSVTLFAARWLGTLARGGWPMRAWARWGSVAIDTALFAAGVTMWVVASWHPLRDRWLGAKLVLVVVYIVLGSFALKRARTRAGRFAFGVLSLGCIGAVAAIALGHDALAPWRWLAG